MNDPDAFKNHVATFLFDEVAFAQACDFLNSASCHGLQEEDIEAWVRFIPLVMLHCHANSFCTHWIDTPIIVKTFDLVHLGSQHSRSIPWKILEWIVPENSLFHGSVENAL
jgi:hypothetical protein